LHCFDFGFEGHIRGKGVGRVLTRLVLHVAELRWVAQRVEGIAIVISMMMTVALKTVLSLFKQERLKVELCNHRLLANLVQHRRSSELKGKKWDQQVLGFDLVGHQCLS
jgi:hypothetical protein